MGLSEEENCITWGSRMAVGRRSRMRVMAFCTSTAASSTRRSKWNCTLTTDSPVWLMELTRATPSMPENSSSMGLLRFLLTSRAATPG